MQRLAHCFKRRKTDAFEAAGLDAGNVDGGNADLLGKLKGGHFPICHNAVESHDDRHSAVLPLNAFQWISQDVIGIFLQFPAVLKNTSQREEHDRHGKQREVQAGAD